MADENREISLEELSCVIGGGLENGVSYDDYKHWRSVGFAPMSGTSNDNGPLPTPQLGNFPTQQMGKTHH
jgi:hypothetical protein